jgi:hypothetical protein
LRYFPSRINPREIEEREIEERETKKDREKEGTGKGKGGRNFLPPFPFAIFVELRPSFERWAATPKG